MKGKCDDVHEYIDRPNDSDIDCCCYMMITTCCSVSVGNVAGAHHCSAWNNNENNNLLSKMQIALSIKHLAKISKTYNASHGKGNGKRNGRK